MTPIGLRGQPGRAQETVKSIRSSGEGTFEGKRLMAFIADINREPVVHTWR